MFFYWLCYILVFIPLRLFFPTKVIGRKNLPKKSKAILACNHLSIMDPIIVNHNLYCGTYIPAKHTLFDNKLQGAILRSWGAIPMNREVVGVSTIRTVLNILQKNKWLLIFPEGTRKKGSDDSVALKNGTALFSIKSGAPIVPMWFMKKPRFFHCNTLIVGKPFYLTEFAGQKLTSEILQQASVKISKEMQALRDNYINEKEAKKLAKLKKKKLVK